MRVAARATAPNAAARRTHCPASAVGAVLLGSFMVALHGRLFGIGLADLRTAFSLSIDEGAWLNTAATAPQIFVAPAVAWLATAFGVRRVLAVPILLYTLLSILIPLVRSDEILLVLHVLHGLLLGLFVPATIMVILKNLPPAWWLPAIGLYAFRTVFSLNAGFSLAGWYVGSAGWQWIYWQDAIVAPLMGLLILLGTRREAVDRTRLRSADWRGMLLLGSGMAMLFAALDQGNRLGWTSSGIVVPLLAGGAVLILAFLVNEAVVEEPWARIGVLASRNVGLSIVVVLMFTLTSLSNTLLIPSFLSTVAGLRPEQIGPLLLSCAALPSIAQTPLCVFLLRRLDPRIALTIGLSAFAIAALLGSHVTSDWSTGDFVPLALLQSVGFAFSLLPLIVIGIANLNPSRSVAFSAYIQVVRLVGNELGLALLAALLSIQGQLHLTSIIQRMANDDAASAGQWRLPPRLNLDDPIARSATGINAIADIVHREATVLAHADAFRLAFWAAVAGLLVVAFIGRAPPGPLQPRPFWSSRAPAR